MTGRQRHQIQILRIPSTHNDPPILRIVPNLVDAIGQLIDAFSRIVGMHIRILGAEMTPLEAVHGTEIALLAMGKAARVEEVARSVAVPNVYLLLGQLVRVCRALDEPQEFLGDAPPEGAFGR